VDSTPYADAQRLVEISVRLAGLDDEKATLEKEERELARRLNAVAPDWSGLVSPYGRTIKYRLSLSTDDRGESFADVEELAESWELPHDYPDPGPPPSLDLPSAPVDDEDPAELVGFCKMGLPVGAHAATDEATK
jgi:hypothetical protein